MAAEKLFGGKDRNAAHAELARILALGIHPRASCREDLNDPDEPFTVWSDGPEPHVLGPSPPVLSVLDDDALIDRIADKILARIEAKLQARGGS